MRMVLRASLGSVTPVHTAVVKPLGASIYPRRCPETTPSVFSDPTIKAAKTRDSGRTMIRSHTALQAHLTMSER